MAELFFDKKDNAYFLNLLNPDEVLYCKDCVKLLELGEYVFIHKSWDKTGLTKSFNCQSCIKKHQKRILDEFIIAEVVNEVSEHCFLVTDKPPQLKTVTNVWDASELKSTQEDIDHTVHAGKESIHGAKIGVEVPEDRHITNIEKEIELIGSAVPETPKRLEDKKK